MLVNRRETEPVIDVVVMEAMGALALQVAELSQTSPIAQYLAEGIKPLTQYEIDILPEYRSAPVPERYWLHSLEMEVYVPIRDKDNLVGIFAFGRKESGETYSDQDLDVLMTVANQTTVVLQNARLVSDLRMANT
jgi:hypothetical protein